MEEIIGVITNVNVRVMDDMIKRSKWEKWVKIGG